MQDYNECAMQRLSDTSKDMEIWWDSSPLIYKSWSQKVIDKTEDSYKAVMKKQLSNHSAHLRCLHALPLHRTRPATHPGE